MSGRRRNSSTRLLAAAIAAAWITALPIAGQTSSTTPSFHLGGFVDATVSRTIDTHRTDLSFGELDLYANAQLSDSWSAFGEGLVQHVGRGSDADVGRYGVEGEIERLYAAYSRSDSFRVQAGRVYTGIIDWNERENRGRFLQTPIDVPAIARRQEQGGAWPLHFLGGWASGRIPGAAGLRYGLGIGQGRGQKVDDVAMFVRGDVSPAGLLSLSIEPDRLTGFRLGVSALGDDIPATEGKYREIDRTVSTSYVKGGIEFQSEWSRMDHRLRSTGRTYVTEGWYALLSVRLGGRFDKLRPYVLLDRLDVALDEPYLANVPDQHSWAVGSRWDVAPRLALKFDYRFQSRLAPRARDAVRLQAAISF
jgi:hypothetical protein